MRVKCLAQEHNVPGQGLEPGPLDSGPARARANHYKAAPCGEPVRWGVGVIRIAPGPIARIQLSVGHEKIQLPAQDQGIVSSSISIPRVECL